MDFSPRSCKELDTTEPLSTEKPWWDTQSSPIQQREENSWRGEKETERCIVNKESIEGTEIWKYSGFSLAELLSGKKRKCFFLLGCVIIKSPSSQSYGFSSSHVWMWELDYKESWALKNWWFWTVVLEKTLESPLDCKEIQPVHPEGNQSWIFIGRTDAEVETQYFGHLMWRTDSLEKTLMLGKIKGRRRRGRQDQMVGWDLWLDGHEFEQVLGVGDGQGSLECCNPWGRK